MSISANAECRIAAMLRTGLPALMLAVLGAGLAAHAQSSKVVYQINCGGPAIGTYSADNYFEGGSKLDSSELVYHANIPNGPMAPVYDSQRSGDFAYVFPNLTPNAVYQIRLHFAEVALARHDFGKRVFSVSINGKSALERFDVLATATDKNVAVVKEFTLAADSTGKIRIVFQSIISTATVSAIEILQPNQGASNTTGTNTSNGSTQQGGVPESAQEENARLTRLSEIAGQLQDPNTNTASLLTEAARLCGFAIWKEDHSLIAQPAGPPLHLAVTDSEIRDFSAMFRSGQSVALADLITSVDYEFQSLGDGQSSHDDVIGWLNTGDKSEDQAVRALTLFLQSRRLFKDGNNSSGFGDPNVQLDPIQALFILRMVTEEIAVPILRSSKNARFERPAVPFPRRGFSFLPASYHLTKSFPDCGEEGKDWAEDGFVGGMARLMERVMHHFNGKEDAEAVNRVNFLISLTKFLSMYSWLKGEVRVEDAPLPRTKTRVKGDGPRTVIATFSIDGAKIADWLKDHRCGISGSTWGLLDMDLPASKPLNGIETSWRIDQPILPSQHIVEPVDGQGNPDRIVTDDNGEAKYAYDGAPQPKRLPDKVVPYRRYVNVSVTPQVKRPEIKQDLVDAVFGAVGIKEGGTGLLTPLFEELYRLKWKGTAHGVLPVRDWRPAGPPELTGGMTIFLNLDVKDSRKEYFYQASLARSLDFKDVRMLMLGPDSTDIPTALLAGLPPAMQQQAANGAQNAADAKKLTFIGIGPGKLSMTIKDFSFTKSTVDLCGDISASEKTSTVIGPPAGSKDMEFGPPANFLPGMSPFTVEVDLEKKIAIVRGDYALPVKITAVTTEDKKTTTTNTDGTRTIFHLLKPSAPFDPINGITVPLQQESLEDSQIGVDASGYSYWGSATIPFTFGKYKGNAYLTFYIKEVTRSQ